MTRCTWCDATLINDYTAARGVCCTCPRRIGVWGGMLAGGAVWLAAAWLVTHAPAPAALVLTVAVVAAQAAGLRALRRIPYSGTTVRGWALFTAGLVPTGMAAMAVLAVTDRILPRNWGVTGHDRLNR